MAHSTSPSTGAEAVVASIAGSTAAVDYPWLAGFVENALQAKAGRAAAAAEHSRQFSESMRQGIRRAIGALSPLLSQSLEHRVTLTRNRIDARGLAYYGTPKLPSRNLIAEELRALDAATIRYVSELKQGTGGAIIGSTASST